MRDATPVLDADQKQRLSRGQPRGAWVETVCAEYGQLSAVSNGLLGWRRKSSGVCEFSVLPSNRLAA
jgi:hypothetical protein